MTREEELIGMLKILKEQALKSCKDTAILDVKIDSFIFVIDEAIKALEQEQYYKELVENYEKTINKLTKVIAEQEPKTGHWSRKTRVENVYDIAGVKTWGIKCQCDRCDFTTIVVEDFGYYKYCPNCGCRMEGEIE